MAAPRVGLGIAALLLTTAGAVTTASALNPGGAVAEGSGVITPGLTMVPTAQSVSFGGTLVGAAFPGSPVAVDDTCSYSAASDITETVAQGDGNGTGSCSGTAAVTASFHYQRIGSAVLLVGSGTVNGASVIMDAHCEFEPTSAPTVATYVLQCVAVVA